MNDNNWHLIFNKLKILIDPTVFASRTLSAIEKQVNLTTIKDYLPKTSPALCDIIFHYPKNLEERYGLKSVYNEYDDDVTLVQKPVKIVSDFDNFTDLKEEERLFYNELLSVAVESKIPFVLCNLKLEYRQRKNIEIKYNISLVDLPETENIMSYFLQGFYNYYKFDKPLYGIDSPDIAHAMSDKLHQKMYLFQNKINISKDINDEIKERVRSFVHNRYIDILITIDRINFYKIQQQISDIERGIIQNKRPQFHGSIRYYLNYYLLLLWGYTDHYSLIVNDIFCFGYDTSSRKGQEKVGLKSSDTRKTEYLEKIKGVSEPMYDYIVSADFQEWLDVLGKMRHKNAHKEMISPSPLLGNMPEIRDEEIDAIIYKDQPPLDDRTYQAMINMVGQELAKQTLEQQKAQDRIHYRISKSEKLFDHFVLITEKDGKQSYLDPVARLYIDKEKIEKMTTLLLDAYNTKHTQTSTP
jgi:hypothetical protein